LKLNSGVASEDELLVGEVKHASWSLN